MPGYVLVNMWLLDDNRQPVDRTWYFIRETTGVIGFAGNKEKPIPMRPSEVEAVLAQVRGAEEKAKPKIEFSVGEVVKVSDGAFQNQSGTVTEIDPERGKIRVSISIFGREAIAELEYWQIERA
jgi:transcriptional antiterminator NusG